jgi:hypothetical protein
VGVRAKEVKRGAVQWVWAMAMYKCHSRRKGWGVEHSVIKWSGMFGCCQLLVLYPDTCDVFDILS